jgi:hypothetical protein
MTIMDKQSTAISSGGTTLLQIAFIVLKLCKVIDWSWWWVLSPIWITTGIVVLIFLVCLFVWLMKK